MAAVPAGYVLHNGMWFAPDGTGPFYINNDGEAVEIGGGGASTFGDLTGDPSDNAALGTVLDGLAPLASPALTGSPTAPTPSASDNSTKIATTAYVDAAIAAGGQSSGTDRGAVLDLFNLPIFF